MECRILITPPGPNATLCVLPTGAPRGLNSDSTYPTPPPHFWQKAAFRATSIIDSSESWMSNLKHPLKVPVPVPRLNKVGLFGRNSRSVIILRYSGLPRLSLSRSPSGVSSGWRYLLLRINVALGLKLATELTYLKCLPYLLLAARRHQYIYCLEKSTCPCSIYLPLFPVAAPCPAYTSAESFSHPNKRPLVYLYYSSALTSSTRSTFNKHTCSFAFIKASSPPDIISRWIDGGGKRRG